MKKDATPKAGLFLMRLRGILIKESLQIIRDPSSIALAIVMPLILLFIFGYGVTLDAEYIPLAMVNEDNSSVSRDLMARFTFSPHFTLHNVSSTLVAEEMLAKRSVDGILVLQDDFGATLLNNRSSAIQLIVNGIDGNRARLIQGYVRNLIGDWTAMRCARGEQAPVVAVSISQRVWFNEGTKSRNFTVPGLITLIMTLIGILLTALVVAREWERGTMEPILVTPLRRVEILLGKIIPYYFLGMFGMSLSVSVAVAVFHVPFRGSIVALFFLSSLFMLASLGFGLLLSAAIRIQFVAAQISIVAGFLPAFFLSGLLFDLESTPSFIQLISHIVPARYFVSISHTLFLAGDVWAILLPNGLVLMGMAIFFLSMAFRNISKRLEK